VAELDDVARLAPGAQRARESLQPLVPMKARPGMRVILLPGRSPDLISRKTPARRRRSMTVR